MGCGVFFCFPGLVGLVCVDNNNTAKNRRFGSTRSPSRLPAMVHSMGSLMETSMEDGEETMAIGNDYITVVCHVTSEAGALSFESGEWRRALPC